MVAVVVIGGGGGFLWNSINISDNNTYYGRHVQTKARMSWGMARLSSC